MLIARLLLALALCFGAAAVALYLMTGNRVYLRFLWRAVLGALALAAVLLIGLILGRFVGVLL